MALGLDGTILLLLIASVNCTSSTDTGVIFYLRTYWNLDILLSWPNPAVIDICDNILLFPGLTCDSTFNNYLTKIELPNLSLGSTIPPELGDLTHLLTLDLSDNLLTGNLPDFVIHLERLLLKNNQLSGPMKLPISFVQIDLSQNSLTGSFPDQPSCSPNAQYIFLQNNNFSGTLPEFLGQCTTLRAINLASNEFTGTVPDLSSLIFLQLLNFDHNEFYGDLKQTFLQTEPEVTIAILNNNQFVCPNPDWCANSLCVQCYPPATNPVDYSSLVDLNNFLSIGWNNNIDPCNNQILFPEITCDNINPVNNRVTQINLSNKFLSGTLPQSLVDLGKLQQADFSGNFISGDIPEFGSLLSYLNLSDNMFTGIIPVSLESLSLQFLDISGNILQQDLKSGHWNNDPSNYGLSYDFRFNKWICSLPSYCDSTGNGLCEPCIVLPSSSPTVSTSVTVSSTVSQSISPTLSFSPTPSSSSTMSVSSSQSASTSQSVSLSPSSSFSASFSPSVSASSSFSASKFFTVSPSSSSSPAGTYECRRDSCGICNGQNTDKDVCGVCFGTNSTCPNVLVSQFSNTGMCILIDFDEPTNRGSMQINEIDCNRILPETTIQLLGVQAYCKWISDCYLEICFGSEGQISPGVKIKFNPVIKDISGSSNPYQGILTISDPSKVPAPVSIIQGPEYISICDTLVLDGTSSKSVVGRTLTFYWEIYQSDSKDAIITSKEPVLSVSELNLGLYSIKLSTMNYLGGIGVSYKKVEIVETPIPIVYIEEYDFSKLDVSKNIFLHGVVQSSICGSNTGNLIFHWMVLHKETPLVVKAKSTGKDLVIASNSLQPNEIYKVIFESGDTLFSNASITIFTIAPDLCSIIKGGSRIISLSEDVLLDGSYSMDPMLELVKFEYNWNCFHRTTSNCSEIRTPCFTRIGSLLTISNSKIVTLEAGLLNPGIYIFTLTVSKKYRTNTSEVTIEILPFISVTGSINFFSCVFRSSDHLQFHGECRNGGTINGYLWKSTFNLQGNTSTELLKKNLAINQFTSPNYISNTISLSCQEVEVASISFINLNPPHLGSVSVSPGTGNECEEFLLEPTGWVSGIPDSNIFYEFFILEGGNQIPLSDIVTVPHFRFPVPVINEDGVTSIITYISNSEGTKARYVNDIYIRKSQTIDFNQILWQIQREAMLMNLFQVNNWASCYLRSSSASIEESSLILDSVVSTSSTFCDTNSMQSVVNVFLMISENCNIDSILKIVYFIRDHVECFPGVESQVVISTFSNILNFRDSLNCTTLTTIRRSIRKITSFRTQNRICGEEFSDISTANILSGTKYDYKENIIETTHYSSDNISSYFFPAGSMNNASECPIVDFTIFKSVPYEVDGDSSVLSSLLVRDGTQSTQEVQEITGANPPITIRLTKSQQNYKPGTNICKYWNSFKWATYGTSLIDDGEGFYTCNSTHLTDFVVLLGGKTSAVNHGGSNSAEPNLLMVILSTSFIAGAIVFMVVVIIIFIVFPDVRILILECESPGHRKKLNKLRRERLLQEFKNSVSTPGFNTN